jgi:hypothetical protein
VQKDRLKLIEKSTGRKTSSKLKTQNSKEYARKKGKNLKESVVNAADECKKGDPMTDRLLLC